MARLGLSRVGGDRRLADPRHQGAGRGQARLAQVEAALAALGHRLLLVQTSGEDAYARTRAFYVRCGCEQAARIRDYYAPGDDMVMFREPLPEVPA